MRLNDKVIVVTGSTKGIGAAIARVCAAEGAKIIVSGRSEAAGNKVVEEIREQGGEAQFICCDISSIEQAKALIDGTIAAFGRIDGLVNNAGVFPRVHMLDVGEDDFDSVMNTNVKGSYFCSQQALRYMVEQHGGAIVNIGSTHWKMGGVTQSVYAMTKGALHTLTQHIAQHYARSGIRCNWVTVGWVLSDGEQDLMREEGHDLEYMNTLLPMVMPSGKFQTGEDIAMACVYLLSDESAQVTGTDIEVTGGFKPEAIPTMDIGAIRGERSTK